MKTQVSKKKKRLTVFKAVYDGFESLFDFDRDVQEAIDPRFNPVMKTIPGEFQGRMIVTITYEEEET